ncbi:MAG: DUF3179 domain-containing protein [Pseudomonadota bacterium]
MYLYKIWKSRVIRLPGLAFATIVFCASALAGSDNGFDLSNSSLPRAEILHGGPPRDGIPALSDPKMIAAEDADYLQDHDRVIGIRLEDETRAYPISILNWHEIVNDEIGARRFAVTYCPLCGTGVAFDAVIDGDQTDFGVSGLLYNSDVLLYDRKTESLWSQIMKQSVAGPRLGKKLTALPISHTTWGDWRKKNPSTLVMSDDTGFFRDYQRNPYEGYEKSRGTYFSVNNKAPDNYHPKEVVVGLEVNGVFKAYPFVELDKQGQSSFLDTINGVLLNFKWDTANRNVEVSDSDGNPIASIQGFWFAWFAFHPDTQVFKALDG